MSLWITTGLLLDNDYHTLVIFWAITFPFHYERLKASGRLKYFHITAIVLAITLPVIPALALLRDGYQISRFPFCSGRSLSTTFYGFVLPFSILSGTTTILIVIASWNMLKVCQIIIIDELLMGIKARVTLELL